MAPKPDQPAHRSDALFGRGNTENLGRRTARGGVFTMTGQIAGFVITMGSTAVLARLLTPADFGIIAKVTAIVGVFGLLKDMGLSMATIQRDRITRQQIDTLFWINVLIGFVLMLMIAAAAPLIGWFYDDPRTVGVTLILAATALLGTLPLQQRALLSRNMRFGSLVLIQVTNQVIGSGVTIYLAYTGWSYWALAMTGLVSNFTALIMLMLATGWFPGPPVRNSGVRSMLKFGGQLSTGGVATYLVQNFDNVMIGRFWGAEQLGLYSKAFALLFQPFRVITGPLNAVIIPALSRAQDDPPRFRELYLRALNLALLVQVPVVGLSVAAAPDLIMMILGEQWMDAVPIFYALSLACLVVTMGPVTNWPINSLGLGRKAVEVSIFNVCATLPIVFVGLPYGAIGVAWAVGLARIPIRLAAIQYILEDTPVQFRDVLRVLRWPFLTSAIACGITVYVRHDLLGMTAGPLRLLVIAAAFSLLYVGLLFAWPPARRALMRGLQDLKRMR